MSSRASAQPWQQPAPFAQQSVGCVTHLAPRSHTIVGVRVEPASMAAPREEDPPKETKQTWAGEGWQSANFASHLLPTLRSSTLRAPPRTSNLAFVSPVIPDFGGRRVVEHVTSLCRPKAAGAPRLFAVWPVPSRDTTSPRDGHPGLHFWDDEVFGEFGLPVASGLDVPALHGSAR